MRRLLPAVRAIRAIWPRSRDSSPKEIISVDTSRSPPRSGRDLAAIWSRGSCLLASVLHYASLTARKSVSTPQATRERPIPALTYHIDGWQWLI